MSPGRPLRSLQGNGIRGLPEGWLVTVANSGFGRRQAPDVGRVARCSECHTAGVWPVAHMYAGHANAG